MVRGSKQAVCARFIADQALGVPGRAGARRRRPSTTLADAFVASGMEIQALVRAIFLHPDFRAPATRTGLVRSPVEWMAASMQVLGLHAAIAPPRVGLERCGQRLYAPPNVGGWQGQRGVDLDLDLLGPGRCAGHCRWTATRPGHVRRATGRPPPADAATQALARFGIDSTRPGDPTRPSRTTSPASRRPTARWAVQPNLVTLCMLSPDFQMA